MLKNTADPFALSLQLRCCCNGSDHHHESFAIPSHVPARSHSHIAQHQHNQLQYQHQHVPQIAPAEHQTPQSTFLAPHQHAFRTHHHYHAHPTEPQYTVNHAAPHLHNSSSVSNTSIPSASASLLSSFLHAGPGYAQNYLAQPSNGPAGHHEIGGSHGSNFLPSPINHSRSHSLPTTAGAQFPPPNMESSPAPAATVAFHCEWSSCSASFPSREELVGHVTVTHLLQVKALTTKSECAPPTPAHSHISSVNRLSETRDGTNNSTQTSQILPNATANMFPSIGHLHFGQSGQANGNVFGDIQNQPTDASFDHTLRCLWDSCEASLPILGDSTGHLPHSDTTLNHQAPSHTHANSVGTADMSHSHGSFQGLPDQSTASLVRHLLQDHLHLPTDVLGQLSPGLPIVPTTGQHGSSANVSGKDGLSQYGSSYMSSGPISSHSTPHSTSGVPSYSTLQSPATYKPPPTPPIASADQQFKFDFGLSGIPNFSSYSTHSEQDRQQPAHQALPMPQSNESSESHSCKWKGCRSTFANTAELMEHISTDHIGSGKSMYYCEWDDCDRAHEGRGFNQRQKVMRHVRTHVGDKPFICSECGRAFSESTTMAQVCGNSSSSTSLHSLMLNASTSTCEPIPMKSRSSAPSQDVARRSPYSLLSPFTCAYTQARSLSSAPIQAVVWRSQSPPISANMSRPICRERECRVRTAQLLTAAEERRDAIPVPLI